MLYKENPYLKDPVIRREVTVEAVYSSLKLSGSNITKESCYKIYDQVIAEKP